LKTVQRNRRHYGGMVVHLGILVIALGLVGSGLFRSEITVAMAPGDVLEVGGERLRYEGVTRFHRHNYESIQTRLRLLDSGQVVTPERRYYPRQEMPMTESGIHSNLLRDVYVVMAEPGEGEKWVFHAYVNPLVQFIWLGGLIILSGLALSLSAHSKRVPQEQQAVNTGQAKPVS
jgi:cytochrome c-type biogenesis protein CcmF